ncbi:hypothetical protein TESG_03060 [Trichophyton tonsurans CBS 112818]|uniref:Cytochrome c n=1 Tax=Trichophyton tonsurans (strain CBS 112818) TaxID=647933 RepID=F2RWB3_TRIT1|nr:hypothetical protein TESG_03060 [Trichophyton tonsurans CBS 112818]
MGPIPRNMGTEIADQERLAVLAWIMQNSPTMGTTMFPALPRPLNTLRIEFQAADN